MVKINSKLNLTDFFLFSLFHRYRVQARVGVAYVGSRGIQCGIQGRQPFGLWSQEQQRRRMGHANGYVFLEN